MSITCATCGSTIRALRSKLCGNCGTSLDLRGADLSDADLQSADLRGGDLRGADLRGADLDGADLRSALLHGADLRSTIVGRGSLVHRGGDPELTWFYDPQVSGARADDETRWPDPFPCVAKGIIYEGRAVLDLNGQEVTVPASDPSGTRLAAPPNAPAGRIGRVDAVHGSHASVWIGGHFRVVLGRLLLAVNLHLLTGQPARYRGESWTIVGHDPPGATLRLARGDIALTAPSADLLSDENLDRWWWHAPGAEEETLS